MGQKFNDRFGHLWNELVILFQFIETNQKISSLVDTCQIDNNWLSMEIEFQQLSKLPLLPVAKPLN